MTQHRAVHAAGAVAVAVAVLVNWFAIVAPAGASARDGWSGSRFGGRRAKTSAPASGAPKSIRRSKTTTTGGATTTRGIPAKVRAPKMNSATGTASRKAEASPKAATLHLGLGGSTHVTVSSPPAKRSAGGSTRHAMTSRLDLFLAGTASSVSTPVVTPARPQLVPPPTLPAALAALGRSLPEAARFPAVLLVLCLVFLAGQHWLDRRDPKLALASPEDFITFGPP